MMASKTTRKPRKLVKVLSSKKKLTADARAILSANARQSPLLRMPPEIRNRIYRYVLGDKVIHMDDLSMEYPKRSPQRVVCQAASTPKEDARSIRCKQSEVGGGLVWKNKHATCTWENVAAREIFSLALLQVCRQIHGEASLVPFSTNTVIFDDSWALIGFTDSLLSEQRTAIASINILETAFGRGPDATPYLEPRLFSKLSGLKEVVILTGVEKGRDAPDPLVRKASAELTKWGQALKYVNWRDVVVCVTVDGEVAVKENHVCLPDFLRKISREMEQTLLEYRDYEAEIRRQQDIVESKRKLRLEEKSRSGS